MVEPAVKIIRSFLNHDANSVPGDVLSSNGTKIPARDLWTQYVCEVSDACHFSLLYFELVRFADDVTVYKVGMLISFFVKQACGNRVLRGAHEWEQHIPGRGHRKRMSHLRKSRGFLRKDQQEQQQHCPA